MDTISIERSSAVHRALVTLSPLELKILKLSFGIGTNFKTEDHIISSKLEIPVEFVEEYKKRALHKLRNFAGSEWLRSFLDEERLIPKKIDVIVPKGIEEVRKLTPELIDHLRTKTDDICKLRPQIFEHFVAELLASRSFHSVKLVGTNKATSADIFATKYVDDIGEHRYFIEVKRWKDRIGVEVIDRVYGARISEQSKFGWSAAVVVSIVGFKKFRKYTVDDLRNLGIYLKDRDDLLFWLSESKENSNGLLVPADII